MAAQGQLFATKPILSNYKRCYAIPSVVDNQFLDLSICLRPLLPNFAGQNWPNKLKTHYFRRKIAAQHPSSFGTRPIVSDCKRCYGSPKLIDTFFADLFVFVM